VPRVIINALGEGNYQSADVVGRSVTLLMADTGRHGELVYSECGKFMDLENGDRGYHAMTRKMLGVVEGSEAMKLLEKLTVYERTNKEHL
jgi:cobyrinic acid a,c-diamide synthase